MTPCETAKWHKNDSFLFEDRGIIIIRSVTVRSVDHTLERRIFLLAFPDELVMIPPDIDDRGCDIFGYYKRTNVPA